MTTLPSASAHAHMMTRLVRIRNARRKIVVSIAIMPQPSTFQQIRSQFEKNSLPSSPESDEVHGGKVIARNRDWFVSEKPWKSREDYERRAGHRRSGFFALPHVPYRPFAGLKYTDAYNLIEEQLKISVPLVTKAHRANINLQVRNWKGIAA